MAVIQRWSKRSWSQSSPPSSSPKPSSLSWSWPVTSIRWFVVIECNTTWYHGTIKVSYRTSKIECGKYTSNSGKNNVKANWQRIKAEGRLKLQRPTEASRPTLSKVAVPPLPLVPTQKMSVTSFRKASAIISWPIIEHCTIPTQNTRNMILIAYEYIDQEAPGASLSPPLRSKNSSPKTGPTLALTSPSGI